MKFKKTAALLMAISMCSSAFGASVFAENDGMIMGTEGSYDDVSVGTLNASYVKSGYCGASAEWGLAADGTLYINGSGAMDNYTKASEQPWYRDPDVISSDPFIKKVVIGSGITSIGDYAFASIGTLESASLAKGGALKDIGISAFRGCSKLASVNFPYRLSTIGENAFYFCESLTELVIPDSVTDVGTKAFYNCSSIVNMSIPIVNVKYHDSVFLYCYSLDHCTLTGKGDMSGSTISPIGGTKIKTLTISDTVTSLYKELASYCYSLHTVYLPEGITSIPYRCFYNCALKKFDVPDSVTSIGTSAFFSNNFTVADLPENLTSIGECAFDSCLELSCVIIPKSLTTIGKKAFVSCSNLNHIHIPAGTAAEQYAVTALPDDTSYYYHTNTDGSCSLGAECPVVAEHSQEIRRKNAEDFVERLYVTLMGRASDPTGKADHVDALLSGNSACEVARGFVLSQELANMGLSNEEFVRRMYKTMLNREPDSAGLADWAKALNNGCTYEYILQGFGGAPEFGNLCAQYGLVSGSYTAEENRSKNASLTGFVSRMYTVALGREYDVNGLNDHTGNYLSGAKDAEGIAYDFIFSIEFRNKNLSNEQFVECMYLTFFDRPYDDGGKADWLSRMAQGSTREDVFRGFTGSQEFKNLVAKFGI